MANEAVLVFETEIPIPMTVSDSTGIEKGTILKMADPMTVSLANGVDDIVGGIAAGEKILSDGHLKIGVYRHGIFKVVASGSISVGDPLGTDGKSTNCLYSNRATTTLSGSKVIGIALETASDTESFLFELNPQCIDTTL